MENVQVLIKTLLDKNIRRLVLSNKKNSSVEFDKIDLNYKNDGYFQAEKYTSTQVFHDNIEENYIESWLMLHMASYKNFNAWSENETMDGRITKKGKILFSSKCDDNKKMIDKKANHNVKKNYILEEGNKIPPLIDLGIFDKYGKVIKRSYDKYKQINRFVEFIDDEIKNIDFSTKKKSIYDGKPYDFVILDFGCGKSYLTFIIYYYFAKFKKVNVKIVGLDLKAKVINDCNEIANKYSYNNLTFEVGDINGYQPKGQIDMVISLHACDKATDYAIFNAIAWQAKYIYSVPCCQHEFNATLKNDEYKVFTDFGIIKERVAALMTDSIRGKLLKACGYRTQLLEFIDIAHSPKNILIRAVKNSNDKKIGFAVSKELESVEKTLKDFNVNSTLYNLLKDQSFI